MSKIKIYRFNHYVNEVADGEELRQWILDNVAKKGLTPTTSIGDCLRIASSVHYSFEIPTTLESVDRVDRIMRAVKIEDVARDFLPLKKRGENYTYDCPSCKGGQVAYISPKYQIYKCFGCGRTGNVVNFVMDVKGMMYQDALDWIENKYHIKK